MKATSRVILVLPLMWVFLSGCAGKPATEQSDHTGRPVAVLGTPKKSVEVYRAVENETAKGAYVLVHVSQKGTKTFYGDELTVGSVLETLSKDLKSTVSGRCPAASGWRFENFSIRASFCKKGLDSARIERAVTLLERAL